MGSPSSGSSDVQDRFGLSGVVLDRKLRIDRAVAQGGFGVVYQGHHLALDRAVAVKVLKTPEGYAAPLREVFFERFALEARIIARLKHPAIVQVLDFGLTRVPSGETVPFMVLEWLQGITLKQHLVQSAERPLPTAAEALALLRPAFEAVAHAHTQAVVHRDLTPANLMLVEGPSGPTLRLLDFGIAKIMDPTEVAGTGDTHTRSTLSAFSLRYAAPEQASQTRTGPWTDVHALALLLTYVLTRAMPYGSGTDEETFAQIFAPTRPTPARHGRDVGAWEIVLARALSLRSEGRFSNAGEFLAALDATLPDAREGYRKFTPTVRMSAPPPPPLIAPSSDPKGYSEVSSSIPAIPVPLVRERPRAGIVGPMVFALLGVAVLGVAVHTFRASGASPAESPSPVRPPPPRTLAPTLAPALAPAPPAVAITQTLLPTAPAAPVANAPIAPALPLHRAAHTRAPRAQTAPPPRSRNTPVREYE